MKLFVTKGQPSRAVRVPHCARSAVQAHAHTHTPSCTLSLIVGQTTFSPQTQSSSQAFTQLNSTGSVFAILDPLAIH